MSDDLNDPLDTLYQAIRDQLSGNQPWDNRIFPDVARGGELRPLIVFSKVTGGDSNRFAQRTPSFLIDVKCITAGESADDEAMKGAAAISRLLNNQGAQNIDENGDPGVVSGDDDWLIKTIVQQGRIHEVDDWTKIGQFIYHSGHEFKIEMEDIS